MMITLLKLKGKELDNKFGMIAILLEVPPN